MEDDVFESAAADLEKSIQVETAAAASGEVDANDAAAVLIKGIKNAMVDLAKGKGGPTTDLKADADKRGTLTDSGKDPAESPKKSGEGYKDSRGYEARKGSKHSSSGKKSSSGKHSSSGMPSFFKKKKKKHSSSGKVAKGSEHEEEAIDGTEFIEELGDAVDHINKSVMKLEEGLACFGELLATLADPRKDKVNIAMSKAIVHLVSENKEIKKSLASQNALMKAISQMPGVPRVAGLQTVVDTAADTAAAAAEKGDGKQLTKAQRDRIFQLAVHKKITTEEMNKAIKTGDASILDGFKA